MVQLGSVTKLLVVHIVQNKWKDSMIWNVIYVFILEKDHMHVYTVKKHLVERIIGIHIQNEFICKCKNVHFRPSSAPLPVRAWSTSGPSTIHVLHTSEERPYMHVYTVKKNIFLKLCKL